MSFLTRTYPFKQSKHLLKDSSIFGVIIWVILYFLQHLDSAYIKVTNALLLHYSDW